MPELDQFSRFSQSQLIMFDDVETFGVWEQPSFLIKRPNEDKIGVFRVTSATEGRPDLISNKLYGTPLLDWVLIAFNNVRKPLNWPRAGDDIEYPFDSIVLPELLG